MSNAHQFKTGFELACTLYEGGLDLESIRVEANSCTSDATREGMLVATLVIDNPSHPSSWAVGKIYGLSAGEIQALVDMTLSV